jgi:sphingomyelin phosphodiesterase 2
MQLRVLTFNIWGVHYISKFINQRIQALIEHLTKLDHQYDIIGLQEV